MGHEIDSKVLAARIGQVSVLQEQFLISVSHACHFFEFSRAVAHPERFGLGPAILSSDELISPQLREHEDVFGHSPTSSPSSR